MKKGIILILLVVSSLGAYKANAQDTVKTLLHLKSPKTWGLYVAPEYQYGQIKNVFTSYVGGSAMLMLNNRFAFGLTAQGSTDEAFSPAGISPLLVRNQFGGLKLEYVVKPASAVHISFPLVIGGGNLRADSTSYVGQVKNENNGGGGKGNQGGGKDGFGGNNDNRGYSAEYGVIIPGINIEANVVKHAKLFVGASYRIPFSVTTNNATAATLLPTTAIQGLSINAGIKVGLFQNSFALPKVHFPSFRRHRRGSEKG